MRRLVSSFEGSMLQFLGMAMAGSVFIVLSSGADAGSEAAFFSLAGRILVSAGLGFGALSAIAILLRESNG